MFLDLFRPFVVSIQDPVYLVGVDLGKDEFGVIWNVDVALFDGGD